MAARYPDLTDVIGSLPDTDGMLNLSPAEACELLSRGAVLVDIREAYETNYRVFDVEEVLYLPWTHFSTYCDVLPRNRALIVADAAGIYVNEAARTLRDDGYLNIARLVGGMIDWIRDGLPVRKDDAFELSGQCACKMKTRHGGNPLIDKRSDDANGSLGPES